jgi:hypothetical protein
MNDWFSIRWIITLKWPLMCKNNNTHYFYGNVPRMDLCHSSCGIPLLLSQHMMDFNGAYPIDGMFYSLSAWYPRLGTR